MSIDVSLQCHFTRLKDHLNLSLRHLICLNGTVNRVFGVQCGKNQKQEREVPMPFRPDVDSWEIDIFHYLACLLITSKYNFFS